MNARVLNEGLKDGTIQPLQTRNTINLHMPIPERWSVVLEIEPEEPGYLTPVIKMDKLRNAVRDLKIAEGKFDLLDMKGDPLTDPVMEGCDVFFKLKPKKEVSEDVLAHSRKRKSVESVDLDGCFFDDDEANPIPDSPSPDLV